MAPAARPLRQRLSASASAIAQSATQLSKATRSILPRLPRRRGPDLRSQAVAYGDPVLRDMQTGIHSRLAKTASIPDGRTVSPDAAYLRQYLQSSQAEPTPLPLPYNVSQFIAFHEGSCACIWRRRAV